MTSSRQSRFPRSAPSLILLFLLGIAACETTTTRPPAPISQGGDRDPIIAGPDTGPVTAPDGSPATPGDERDFTEIDVTPIDKEPETFGFTPPHMAGRDVQRFAVLLPFSHPRANVRREAQGLLAAMELALFNSGNDTIVLLPKDTGGTPVGAVEKAREAIDDGADVFVGPLFADNVIAVRDVAWSNDLPVIAFSNSLDAAGNGAFLVSISPEEEVERAIDYAVRRGIRSFAYLGPNNSYGQRVEGALRRETALRGATVLISSFYSSSDDTPVDAAQLISDTLVTELDRTADRQKIAVLIPERGVKLRSVAPLLPYYGVDTRRIQFIGTGAWNDPTLWREPTLANGVFAAPPSEALSSFNERYERNYNREASTLASQGYDAVALAIQLSEGAGLTAEAITNGDGFYGANGLFRFRSDGTAERGLALYEINQDGTLDLVEPAPRAFTGDEG